MEEEEKVVFCINCFRPYSKEAIQESRHSPDFSRISLLLFFYDFTPTHYPNSSGQREGNRNISRQRQPKIIRKKRNISPFKI